MLIRAWLILRLKGTNKVVILKRSKKSRNSGQWDFIGGSSRMRRYKPRKLIRKESLEEIGIPLFKIKTEMIIRNKYSTYYYFSTTLSSKDLERLQLNYEHSEVKLLPIHKLTYIKKAHHSIRTYLKNINHESR